METLGPVTLIVKAPNQRVEDRRVACDRSWTVGQLKEHLSFVYPERPHKDQQKLVYYGKLLQDESCLHEVLTQESFDDAHTVHLVCPQHASASHSMKTSAKLSAQPVTAADAADTVPRVAPDTSEGLRNRLHPIQPDVSQQQAYWASYSSQWLQQASQAQEQITPQQRLWIQAYQQQLQQQYLYLMQFQQAQWFSQTGADTNTTQTTNDNTPAQQQPANQRPAPQPQEDNVQMNAQGGVDDDVIQRDWLDHLYALMRFCMLLCLLYFYTTLSRFIMVFAVGAFFYFAQGNFRLRRRQPAAVPAQPEQNNAENQNNENNERDTVDGENNIREERPPPQPSAASQFFDGMKLAFSFFFTFFSSLIPQNPAPVAAN